MADQLAPFITDYDVCLLVAKLYIQIRKIEGTEECREFYMGRIWEEKPGKQIKREKGSLGDLAAQVHLWNPSYIEAREAMTNDWNRWPFNISSHHNERFTLKSKINIPQLTYLASERGIRDLPYWRISASSWGVKNMDKVNITLKDKLDDIKLIPNRILKKVYLNLLLKGDF